MELIKLDIQLFGGRGASSFGGTRGGKLMGRRGKPSEQLDISALQGFSVKEKAEFEKFMDMKANEVEYGYLMDKDGKVVAGAKGNRHSVGIAYNGSEEGFDLTHNHPDAYGGTFSGPDIAHLTEAKLHSIRAVAKEGTYSMTAKKGANFDGLNRALAKDMKKLELKGSVRAVKKQTSGGNKNQVRKAYVDTLHEWYTKNASNYGFTYKFKANKDYDIKTAKRTRRA